jgi:hypothetical protein
MFRRMVAMVLACVLVGAVADTSLTVSAKLPDEPVGTTGGGLLANFAAVGDNLIRLQAGAFDPLVPGAAPAPPGIPLLSDLSGLDPNVANYWIVQVKDDRFAEAAAAITAAGALRAGALLDDSYVVRATPLQIAAIASPLNVAFIRWTGLLQPAWRVRTADNIRGKGLFDLAGAQDYRVHLFRIEPDKAGATAALAAIPGVTILAAGGSVVDLHATPDQLAAIAAVPAVEWVSLVPETFPLNEEARWVIDTGVRDLLAATRSTRLTGLGQTAGVADTASNYKPDQNGRAHIAFRDCDVTGTICKEADYTQTAPGTELAQVNAVVDNNTNHRKMAAFFDYGATGPEPHDESSHGTHTSGSVAGDAFTPGVADGDDGIAPGARLVHQNLGTPSGGLTIPTDIYDMFAQAYRPRDPASVSRTVTTTGNPADYISPNYVPTEDARTHNNSWGSAILGIVPTDEQAVAVDRFVWDHEDMTIVVSAGNDGPEVSTVGDPASAKNNLDSGASANGRQPMASIDSMASFSSHGPTTDGRFGPTVATPGQIVISAKGGSVDDYHYAQGTSMSGPVLTGATTLIRQYFFDGYAAAGGDGFAAGTPSPARQHNPSAALVKATAVNGAVRMRGYYTGTEGNNRAMDGEWPSGGQGFGLLNLDNSLYFAASGGLPADPLNNWYHDVYRGDVEAFPTGTVLPLPASPCTPTTCRTYQLSVAAGMPLDVTLSYTDAPNLLPQGTPALVNNLDLTVQGPGIAGPTYIGNNFNSRTSPSVNDATTPPGVFPPDIRNNTERIRVLAPTAGVYTITVRGTAVLDGNQGFALAASGDISPVVGAAFVPGPARQADVAGTPTISNVAVEAVSSDMSIVRFTTNEPTTATVTRGAKTWIDHYNRGPEGFPEYGTPAAPLGPIDHGRSETSAAYANRPVVTTQHEVLLTGLDSTPPGGFTIEVTDLAGPPGNTASVPLTHSPPAYIFQPDQCDEGNLQAAPATPAPPTGTPPPTNVGWCTSGQMYAAAGLLGAFMFRVPETFDPAQITGAVVELSTGHQWTIPYDEDPIFYVDLLNQSVEPNWGTQTYETIHNAAADARFLPETTVRDGLTKWQFAIPCKDLDKLKATLTNTGERKAAFRYDVVPDGPGLLSVDPGFNRRSRGPQYRPKLILLTGTNPSGSAAPCDPATPAPTISDVGVHAGSTPNSATVSWRTDVPSDSLVLFREKGTTEYTQVGTRGLSTVHQVEVLGLDPNKEYEFGVRSATCSNVATTADNLGAGWDFFHPPVPEQPVQTYWFHGGPGDQAAKVATFGSPTGNGISTAATFSTAPPDGSTGNQSTIRGNPEFAANSLEAYWYAPASVLSGPIDTDINFAFSLAGAGGFGIEIGVWADVESAGGTATKIGSGTIDTTGLGPTPQMFEGKVHVKGTVTTNMVIQLTPQFLDDDGLQVFYDDSANPSRFEIPVGTPPPAPDLPTSGPVPPPSAGSTGLNIAAVQTRRNPTAADLAAGTCRCLLPAAPGDPANVAPTAVLTASPTSGQEALTVTFNGSASSDPDDGLFGWTLDYGDGSTPSTGSGRPPAAQPHVYLRPGTFTATLTVRDTVGASNSTSVQIVVTARPGGSGAGGGADPGSSGIPPGTSAGFTPVGPERLFDTRGESPNALRQVPVRQVGGGYVLEVRATDLTGFVPASGVGAVSLNVAVDNARGPGFVTVYPCNQRKLTASVNYAAGEINSNAVVTPVSPTGTVCFYSHALTDIIVDVNGWFVAGPAGVTTVGPERVFDTRGESPNAHRQVPVAQVAGGTFLEVKMTDVAGVPASGVGAVLLNVAVDNVRGPGFVTAYPCGQRPFVASVNYVGGQTVSNGVVAPVSSTGTVCFYTHATVDLVVDISGWFASGGVLRSVGPRRVFDTRGESPNAMRTVPIAKVHRTPLEVKVTDLPGVVPATGARAVSLNVAVTDPNGPGFVTVYPCNQRKLTASVNYAPGETVSNAVLMPVSPTGTLCFYSHEPTHIVVDINGWFSG